MPAATGLRVGSSDEVAAFEQRRHEGECSGVDRGGPRIRAQDSADAGNHVALPNLARFSSYLRGTADRHHTLALSAFSEGVPGRPGTSEG
jgi:hypothetical protein